MKDYNYMRALWAQFSPQVAESKEWNRLYHRLQGSLSKNQRRQLLQLMDAVNIHSEIISLESFVAGFRLAAGIAEETMHSSYSFIEAEEERACRQAEQ